MNAKKIGRPTTDNPKNYEIRTRVNEKTNKKINDYCKENNITRSDLLRKGIDLVLDMANKKE